MCVFVVCWADCGELRISKEGCLMFTVESFYDPVITHTLGRPSHMLCVAFQCTAEWFLWRKSIFYDKMHCLWSHSTVWAWAQLLWLNSSVFSALFGVRSMATHIEPTYLEASNLAFQKDLRLKKSSSNLFLPVKIWQFLKSTLRQISCPLNPTLKDSGAKVDGIVLPIGSFQLSSEIANWDFVSGQQVVKQAFCLKLVGFNGLGLYWCAMTSLREDRRSTSWKGQTYWQQMRVDTLSVVY